MEHEVFVPVPADRLRRTLADPARVARCVPGLQRDADASAGPLAGRLKVRVGGHTITYRGALRVTGRDGGFTAEGEGTEVRGHGSVKVALTALLTDTEGGTTLSFTGTAHADGRLAEAAPDAAEKSATRLLDRFAASLAAAAEDEEREAADGTAEAAAGGGGDATAEGGDGSAGGVDEGAAPGGSGGAAAPAADPGAAGRADSGTGAGRQAPGGGAAADAAGAERGGEGGADRRVAADESPDQGADQGAGQSADQGADEGADEGAAPGGSGGASGGPDAAAGEGTSASRTGPSAPSTGENGAPGGPADGDEDQGAPLFEVDVPPSSLDPLADEVFGEDGGPPAEAAHARRTMIGRSAEEVDHAPPRGRYAPVPAPRSASAGGALRWVAPAAALAIASAVVVGRALRRRR
ncbi:SRPBCC domain-containing protein [Streptomyces spongiicola]|uniref:SRPBCC family protein n=1 Tax=Streptomyces spongiicola TaxID=1690221 RepID=UPI0033DB501A